MVLGDDSLEEAPSANVLAAKAAEIDDAPSTYNVEMMESIVQRLRPEDRHQIRDMISSRGNMSGALGITCFLFWWVAVHMGGESLGDSDLPASMISDFNYYRLTLVVPALALVATILLTMGREKGQSLTSNAGGVLAVLALFLVLEPLGRMTLLGDLDTQTALTASGRLAIIATLIHLATKMMVDSILLEWVRGSMMSMDIDVLPTERQDSVIEGHADEAPPLV
uniref:Uncharacterized protein n=1 Tax=uncultured marine group II/III euryarchaeote SAT1000_07_H02 TaxID=1456555 RepID=A0A075I0K0_9EURY|nr:hypothetical protein [uncultured marine group II/III euryarchaeote SAT1000_07_H02]